MNKVAKIKRYFAKLKFKVLGKATIKDIPTDKFNDLIKTKIDEGWNKIYVYDEFDAWIDYGKVIIKKDGIKLTFEWDNWTEGSVEGPSREIEKLAIQNNLKISNEWRWAEYDEKP